MMRDLLGEIDRLRAPLVLPKETRARMQEIVRDCAMDGRCTSGDTVLALLSLLAKHGVTGEP